MALTGYIGTSLACVVVFGSISDFLFGSWSHAETWTLVGFVWLGLLVTWRLWLIKFQFGPLEWLWRSLTFLRLQPMRRISASSPGASAPID
jgi:uncharacterized protein